MCPFIPLSLATDLGELMPKKAVLKAAPPPQAPAPLLPLADDADHNRRSSTRSRVANVPAEAGEPDVMQGTGRPKRKARTPSPEPEIMPSDSKQSRLAGAPSVHALPLPSRPLPMPSALPTAPAIEATGKSDATTLRLTRVQRSSSLASSSSTASYAVQPQGRGTSQATGSSIARGGTHAGSDEDEDNRSADNDDDSDVAPAPLPGTRVRGAGGVRGHGLAANAMLRPTFLLSPTISSFSAHGDSHDQQSAAAPSPSRLFPDATGAPAFDFPTSKTTAHSSSATVALGPVKSSTSAAPQRQQVNGSSASAGLKGRSRSSLVDEDEDDDRNQGASVSVDDNEHDPAMYVSLMTDAHPDNASRHPLKPHLLLQLEREIEALRSGECVIYQLFGRRCWFCWSWSRIVMQLIFVVLSMCMCLCMYPHSGLHVVYQHKVKFLDEEHRIRCERAERERTAALLCVENAYQAQLQTISDEIDVL
jgi:hypothetical protein